MASLSDCFKQALSDIEPDEDVKNAIDAHTQVSEALAANPKLKELGISTVLIGSYARSVSIKRIKDVDVFGRLEAAEKNLTPVDALDFFESALVDVFGGDRVERQARSFKVSFPDYDLTADAVPARVNAEHWEIPERPQENELAEWVETDPLLFNVVTKQANSNFMLNGNGIYVPTVKLVRQVRRAWLGDHPGGFFLEVMAYWAFTENGLKASSQAEYLTLALEKIAESFSEVAKSGLKDATLSGKTISTKATAEDFDLAVVRFDEAAKLARDAFEDEDDCSAAIKFRKLLGKNSEDEDVFPLPGYCNVDGSRKATSSITPGSNTVPAGNDRYA